MATIHEIYDEGTQLRNEGDMEGAVAKWYEALESEPDHVLSHMALGVTLQKLGRFEDAIKHAVRVTEIEPDDHFAFTQLSVIYQRCGQIPQAEFAMAKAHEIRSQQ